MIDAMDEIFKDLVLSQSQIDAKEDGWDRKSCKSIKVKNWCISHINFKFGHRWQTS